MSKSEQRLMLDRSLFESPEAAVAEAEEWARSLTAIGMHSFYAGDIFLGAMSPAHMFLLSCISRAQGIVKTTGKEIVSGGPHSAFPLLRGLMETGGLVLYAIDHPDYVADVQSRPSEGGVRRVSWQKVWAHVSRQYPGVNAVWREICEAAHPGAAAMWLSWKNTGGNQVEHGPGWVSDDSRMIASLWLWEFTRLTHDATEKFKDRVLVPLNHELLLRT